MSAILHYIKRLRITYTLYNILHRPYLQHNLKLYKKYGIRKKYYSSISSADFKHLPPSAPYLPQQQAIEQCTLYRHLPLSDQQSLLHFGEQGFAVLKGYVTTSMANQILKETQHIIQQGKVREAYGERYLQVVKHSPLIRQLAMQHEFTELLSVLAGGPLQLFQSIHFNKGSQQSTHSDSFHMSTYPHGGLIGVWIALEDVHPQAGPLHYYPASHLLPYFTNEDFGNTGKKFTLGKKNYPQYAAMIQQKIEEYSLKKEIFEPSKGDVLIWHANLLHGGEKQINPSLTRHSMVLHYMRKDVICYHEILERPAIIRPL